MARPVHYRPAGKGHACPEGRAEVDAWLAHRGPEPRRSTDVRKVTCPGCHAYVRRVVARYPVPKG